MLFDRPRVWHGGVRRLIDWVFTVALLAAGTFLFRDATAGRSYPWSAGKVFFAAVLFWLAAMRIRFGIALIFQDLKLPGAAALAVSLANRAVILALTWFPGLAAGWYAIEAANSPSRNSRGRDVCDTSAAQFCVSGPRALIPWAILLLVFSGFATWYWFWNWTGGRRRAPAPPRSPREESLARVAAVIPPDDEPAAGGRSADPDLEHAIIELGQLARMREDGHLTDEEFARLKGELVRRATDGA